MRLYWALAVLLAILPACARGGDGGRGPSDAGARAPFDAARMDVMGPRDAAAPVDSFIATDAPIGFDAGVRPDAGCAPSCVGIECGDDGCGGSCGTCTTGACVGGTCSCTPSCSGRTCGDDGCGGSCGTCPTGTCVGGTCSCTPSCSGRTCGDDGCGGSCGTCGSLCTDTCTYFFDFDCDDGGPLSDYSLCDLGTDCLDCGPRATVCSAGTCVAL